MFAYLTRYKRFVYSTHDTCDIFDLITIGFDRIPHSVAHKRYRVFKHKYKLREINQVRKSTICLSSDQKYPCTDINLIFEINFDTLKL